MSDKDDRKRFFEESFLLSNVKPDVVLGMPFLSMSNTNVDFKARDLQWNTYITRNILPTTRQVELIKKKEIVLVTPDPKYKVFIVYVAVLNIDLGDKVHPTRQAQIVYVKADEAFTKVLSNYANFADVFSSKLTAKLPKHTRINNQAIELVDDW